MAQASSLTLAVAVFLGGGAGALSRWLVGRAVPVPWGTLTVNLLGSFLLATLLHPRLGATEPWRIALGTGLLGGFTTYSTFNLDVLAALRDGRLDRALLLITSTLVGCLIAGALGWSFADRLTRPS